MEKKLQITFLRNMFTYIYRRNTYNIFLKLLTFIFLLSETNPTYILFNKRVNIVESVKYIYIHSTHVYMHTFVCMNIIISLKRQWDTFKLY